MQNMTLPVLLVVLSANLKGLRIELDQGTFLGEGDRCNLPNNGSGICSKILNCPEVAERIQLNEEPVICSFDQFVSFVCCPTERGAFQQVVPTSTEASPLTPPTNRRPEVTGLTKSEQACNENYQIMLRVRNTSLPEECEEFYYDGPGVVGGEDARSREFPHMLSDNIRKREEGYVEVEKKAQDGEMARSHSHNWTYRKAEEPDDDDDDEHYKAALGYGEANSIRWLCGGALISSRFVLTAGHCLAPAKGVRWVRLGDLDYNSTFDDARPQQFSVIERIPHPEYKAPSLYNDIALLRLDRDVIFNNYVRPACLNIEDDLIGNVGEATGWGVTNTFGPLSSVLQRATLPVQPKEACEKNYHSLKGTPRLMNGFDDATMLCVGDSQGEMDTCSGDSGGPYHKEKDPKKCIHIVAGITSFGKTVCGALKDSPAVYTRVSKFVPWIESIVWP